MPRGGGVDDPTYYLNHTLARYCESVLKVTKQVSGKGQNSTLATLKPLNRFSQKLAGVIMSWMPTGMQNFVAIGSGVSVPQIRDIAVLLG